jgi:flavin reductase (DIM6/NTAB) family NADH-FMN oxidoreductase RutF
MPVSAAPGVAPDALRSALGAWPTGVSIVTGLDPAGRPVGMTVGSFAGLSLEPPLVLWSAQRGIDPFDAFERAGLFAVHLLAADQAALSDRFARPDPNRFDGVGHRPGIGGLPLLDGCGTIFQCAVEHRYEGGDHLILVGRVLQIEQQPEQPPLVFHQGRYRGLG